MVGPRDRESVGVESVVPEELASAPARLLRMARDYDLRGHLEEAAGGYGAAIRSAERESACDVLAEALRRLAVLPALRHRADR